MTLGEIVNRLSIEALTPYDEQTEVAGAYISDLLSDVIANSSERQLWLTLQGHQNVVAVALLNDLAGVIITGGYAPAVETVAKASEKGIALFSTSLNSFELGGKIYLLLNELK